MKITIMLLIISSSVFAQSQTSEGNHSIGGNISFSSTLSNPQSSTLLDISPDVSIFLRDNFELGAKFSTQFMFNSRTTALWGIGPFMNLYFSDNPVKPLLGIQYTYSYYDYGYQRGHSGNQFTLQGGFLVPLNPKVAVLPVLQLNFLSNSTYQVLMGISLKAFL
jgi:hypothetical protein